MCQDTGVLSFQGSWELNEAVGSGTGNLIHSVQCAIQISSFSVCCDVKNVGSTSLVIIYYFPFFVSKGYRLK